MDFAKRAVSSGYKLDLIFIALRDPDLSLERIRERVRNGGHDVAPEKVRARYHRSVRYLREYVELADTASVYDNSGERPILVFMKKDGIGKFLADPEEYGWISEYLRKQ